MSDMGPFETFRNQPSPETLLALLTEHQDAVYSVCFQVLRHSQDAEDAAQAVLLKLASEARKVREPRAFKAWLYRIAFHTAVDHRRRRDSLRTHEGSGPMQAMSPTELNALHDALAELPDADRLILAEYYFEKSTLEDLGGREGVSGVAIWKRLEKAREKLRRGLAGAGFAIGAPQIAQALDAVTQTSAPAGFVASTFTSKAALVAAGGAAMGSQKTFGVVIVVLIVALAGGLGTVYFLNKSSAVPESKPADSTSAASPRSESVSPETKSNPPETPRGDAAACRRLLASRLVSLRRTDVVQLASAQEILHSGGFPWFESLASEFIAAAGPDLLPIVKALLADTESDAAKSVLAALLGRSRLPDAVPVLAALTSDGTDLWVIPAALYAIGVIRSPEGFTFLRSYWEQAKAKGEPLAPAAITSLGLFGSEAIPLLVEAAKAEKSLFRNRAEYLSLIRGEDCADALIALLATEENEAVKEGAARALTYNLSSENLRSILSQYEQSPDPKIKAAILYGLMIVQRNPPLWESTLEIRKDFAGRVVDRAEFPSGTLNQDRALIHLSTLAPDASEAFFRKFEALNKEGLGKDYVTLLREVLSAYSRKPGYEDRLDSLMKQAGMTSEQQDRFRAGGFMKTDQELTAENTKSFLESIRSAKPFEPRYEIAFNSLARPGPHESEWSAAMQHAFERCATEKERIAILDHLVTVLYGKRNQEVGLPLGFLNAVLTGPATVDAKIHAAYACLSAGPARDLDPQALKQIADLVGPSMKWAVDSSLATGEFRMVQLAPSVLGDYYSRYGTAADVAWLRKLPEEFPYPAHKVLKDELTRESKRAIDAIRLRQ